jgi:trehalose 6-phosphate synthase/phosphatase
MQGRLIVVSNRLPFAVAAEDGGMNLKESPGGLVSGIAAYLHSLRSRDSGKGEYLWVGWPGATVAEELQPLLREKAAHEFASVPVFLTQEEMEAFYFGFCNKTLWPLFHYFPSYAAYKEGFWRTYVRVNEIFRDAVAAVARPNDSVWVHDYHLMLLPGMLRAKLPGVPIGFFLHIPFPSFEIYRLLPMSWRREILEGMLGADLIGFHTYDYVQHFLQSVRRVLGYEHHMGRIVTPDHIVKAGMFPMGVDFDQYASGVDRIEVERERADLQHKIQQPHVILSVDRLDYTKGIINRLQGYERLLETQHSWHGNVVLIMVVVPSRVGVEHYDIMKKQIEELVGKINGKFGNVGWSPVVYQYRSLGLLSLLALYSISDIALVTPLRDGMNLVSKEYVASRRDLTGVLILSEMAGSAKELGEAVIINPNNIEEIAGALREALEMPVEEQKRRNRIMQHRLRRYTVVRWADEFIGELGEMTIVQREFCAKLLPAGMRRQLLEDYNRAAKRLVLLDYDGTLVPLARHPHLARPGPELQNLLFDLSTDPNTTCVLVSGRDRETLEGWFGWLPLQVVAEHGSWVRTVEGEWRMPHPVAGDWMPAILPILESYADRLPGSFVEAKDRSIAWHFRTADPDPAELLVGEMLDHLVNFTANNDIQVLRGHKVVEVRNAGANKGNAVLEWVSTGGYDFVLACGDDQTDEDMFEVLPKTAYSIRVGIVNTRARYNVRTQDDIVRLLHALVEAPPMPVQVKAV